MPKIYTFPYAGINYYECPKCKRFTRYGLTLKDVVEIRGGTRKSSTVNCACGNTFFVYYKYIARRNNEMVTVLSST